MQCFDWGFISASLKRRRNYYKGEITFNTFRTKIYKINFEQKFIILSLTRIKNICTRVCRNAESKY